MANFSGVFSSNDQSYTKVCGGLIEFRLAWEVIRDLDYNQYKYKADLYMDATKCKYVTVVTEDNMGDLTDMVIGQYVEGEDMAYTDIWARHRFDMPSFGLLYDVSKVIHLGSVETDWRPAGAEPFEVAIYANICPDDKLRAHEKTILSYVENRDTVIPIGDHHLVVQGIEPNGIKSIDGTTLLNSGHKVSVNRTDPDFTHTIEYICGSDKVTVCTKSKADSFNFTPALALAAHNTTGLKLSTTFYIHTYYGDRLKGTKTVEYEFTIPDSVKPSCTVEVKDGEFRGGEHVAVIYGGFVRGHSRFRIKVLPALAYGSPIEEYEVEVDGLQYTLTDDEMDTPIITASGAHSIKARVTDARGRTSELYSTTVNVQPYTAPSVTDLTAARCNKDGTENPKGDHMKVVFSAAVTPLNNKNSATYIVTHSKTSGLEYYEGALGDYTGQYNVANGEYIFEADTLSSYVVQVTAKDDFEEHTRTVGGGLTTILMNWLASGRGMCFGGIATLEDTVECKFKFYPSGGLLIPPYPYDNLFIREPNTYYVENPADILNCPVDDPFIFEIMPVSDDGLDILQRITTCPQGEAPRVLVRTLVSSSWGQFYDMTTGQSI